MAYTDPAYTDTPLLRIRGLSKSYGRHRVLTDLDLTLPPGVHALLGPNGSGKTTLVNILSTLLPYDSGEVRVLGLDPRRDRKTLQGLISLTGQYAAVDEKLSGTENMLMMGQLFGLSRRDAQRRADDLLERFELSTAAHARVATYSGGMRRKLDIAAGLIAHPQLIFLDEPTTGLDTRSRQALWDEITALADSGASVFLTTQYLEEADALAERIVVLHEGNIVADGTAAQLKGRIGGSTIQLHDDAGHILEEIPTRGSAIDVARHLDTVARTRPDVDVTVRRPTLDEVFLELTGEQAGAPDQKDADREEVAA
ncbi:MULTISPECIES: ATP-binding cassette domain-containing protein [Prauserella salsuginis group]|uniref:ABC-2 type transport system ATP-binding protein n=2 Tax=Prauserella salsuginis group TaxID=2893672 RepID=A0A839XHM3_9PSEU|nr:MULTISPECIES: ATP-binding cassette domain-containing protein [Prauserella salsuginis group]MBB3661249.1 ABC-2 type transport system ATP-binding protein [Prauserella sediminis]MCR3719110.1 ABC-2 type transport system ATP-binding protein [Prauserella flava]MCR3733680.1 ABC-2 type transport system ATP-binding protein [Prauserella salsuginis]